MATEPVIAEAPPSWRTLIPTLRGVPFSQEESLDLVAHVRGKRPFLYDLAQALGDRGLENHLRRMNEAVIEDVRATTLAACVVLKRLHGDRVALSFIDEAGTECGAEPDSSAATLAGESAMWFQLDQIPWILA